MKLRILPVGALEANCCLAFDEESRKGIILDPGAQPDRIRQAVEKSEMVPEAILLTHGHFDHVMASDTLRELYGVPVLTGENELALLRDPELNLSRPYMRKDIQAVVDRTVQDQEMLPFFGGLQALEVAGHTPGSMCYYIASEGVLFSGDTLFQRSIGRTDSYEAQDELLRNIRKKLLVLPADTEVIPGHGPATNIGSEKRYNLFLA